MSPVQKALLTGGIALILLALAWPWLARLGLFRLPGDIRIERDGFTFYFPLTTMILISLVISAIALALRWIGR